MMLAHSSKLNSNAFCLIVYYLGILPASGPLSGPFLVSKLLSLISSLSSSLGSVHLEMEV